MDRPRPSFTAGQICRACSGQLQAGEPTARAQGISTDTRTLARGQAFLALRGENHDAHTFIPAAVKAGASILIVEKDRPCTAVPDRTAVIGVTDTTRALMDLARWHRNRLEGLVLAITGSCGKSTVKAMVGSILSRSASCSVARKSFNNRIGVSLSLLQSCIEDDYVVLELGTNHPGEIDELAAMARPHAGLITCIGECHLEGLGSREGVREAKAELIPHIEPDGLLVLNADDDFCASLADRHEGEVRMFGIRNEGAVRAIPPTATSSHGEFCVRHTTFRLPVAGRHNILNAAAAICLAEWAGASLEQARTALAEVRLPGLRSEKRMLKGTEFLMDCYNSNPTAMKAALESFLRQPVDGRRMVVCGDMLELGDDAPAIHRRMGRALALTEVDTLVAVGPLSQHMVEGWNELAAPHQRALHLPSAEKAWMFVWELTAPGDAVLLKGSRKMELERIVKAIEERMDGSDREEAA
jgi:UDP-N-acetylmuramoyl-tripeptide--D-alanyl-D-alanine ligase